MLRSQGLRIHGLRLQWQRIIKASQYHNTTTKTCLDFQLVAPWVRSTISTRTLKRSWIGWHLRRWLRGEDIAVEEHMTLHTALVVADRYLQQGIILQHTALAVADRYLGQGIPLHHRFYRVQRLCQMHLAGHRSAEDEDVVYCLA
jgi:hypothetical protein